jgi:Mg2+ and Co2+ transporter CorA
MNFSHLPGAQDHWGWIVALSIMVLSSVAPYLVFKRRGWL